jgi:ubiquinone/menaquinone biosynthesis C-methylase UbiE
MEKPFSTALARPVMLHYINSLLRDTDIVLDVGCGTKEVSRGLKCKSVTTLDVWQPFEPDIWCDLNTVPQLPCEDNTYEMVLLIDVIEHLPKDSGFKILKEAKRVTNKYVVILTPLWWDPNLDQCKDPASPYYQNEYDKHLSFWQPEDLVGFEHIDFLPPLQKYFFGIWRKT